MSQPLPPIESLLYLMRRLRNPDTGCPWDLKQTFSTIVPYTLEEVYEVVDAIEREDYPHLREELGDLLFQVVFYSQLGEEQSLFNFNDVVETLVEKLVSRHPHVFPDGSLESRRESEKPVEEPQIKRKWESIKSEERRGKGFHSILADVPASLPALSRAQKLQKRAANQGFDWPSSEGVINKLDEERNELKMAIEQGNQDNIEEELGDMMFTLVNLCRHLKVDAETSLRLASRKFEKRFHHVENAVLEKGQTMSDLSLEQLDQLWDEAKQQ
jgi:ATP diphosphatase